MSNVTTLRRASTTFKNALTNSTADDVREQIAILEELRKELSDRQTELRDAAITLGLARMGVGKPRELAPTRDMYIKAHGLDAFNQIKRSGKAPETFTWND